MLCVNSYSQDYINHCRARIETQLDAYQALVSAAHGGGDRQSVDAALASFEPQFFNNLLLVLDNLFCHRSRTLEKKDGNPLNEVRLLCNSLLINQGKLMDDKSIRLDPRKSILGYQVGDDIHLSAAAFKRLYQAYFSEIENKFLQAEMAI